MQIILTGEENLAKLFSILENFSDIKYKYILDVQPHNNCNLIKYIIQKTIFMIYSYKESRLYCKLCLLKDDAYLFRCGC